MTTAPNRKLYLEAIENVKIELTEEVSLRIEQEYQRLKQRR